jgi:hypothetical protein
VRSIPATVRILGTYPSSAGNWETSLDFLESNPKELKKLLIYINLNNFLIGNYANSINATMIVFFDNSFVVAWLLMNQKQKRQWHE